MDARTLEARTLEARTLIRDLPAESRPRERLRDFGADALGEAELLAILLRTGTARQSALDLAHGLLGRFGTLLAIYRAPFAELCGIHGVGEAKAAQIKAALTLGVRAARQDRGFDGRRRLQSPDDVAALVMDEMSMLDQEQVRMILLDSRSCLISTPTVYTGSAHSVHMRTAELFSEAVRAKASAVVMVHNHPSGNPLPSAEDIRMTRQLVEAGRLLDIDVSDHLVIGGGRYVSMRAAGLGFAKEGA